MSHVGASSPNAMQCPFPGRDLLLSGSATGGGDRQPAEAAKDLGAAAGSATQHRHQVVKVTKRAVEVKIPLLCKERGIQKQRAARTRRQKAQSHAEKPSSSAS